MRRALVVALALAGLSCASDPPLTSPDLSPADAAAREVGAREAAGPEARPADTGGDRSTADRKPWPTCVDGTPVGGCAAQRPLRCNSALKLEHDCTACGCPGFEACNPTTKGCAPVTVALSPTADSYVVEAAPAENHGLEETLKVGAAWNGASHGFLAFDLSKIPPQATIDAATLTVTVVSWGGTAFPAQVRLVGAPWAEQQISWSNQPAVKVGGPTTLPSLGFGPNPIDAKLLVAWWLASPTLPYGFRIARADSASGSVSLGSREHPTAGSRPQLTITYR
jgi:hypothetical protein